MWNRFFSSVVEALLTCWLWGVGDCGEDDGGGEGIYRGEIMIIMWLWLGLRSPIIPEHVGIFWTGEHALFGIFTLYRHLIRFEQMIYLIYPFPCLPILYIYCSLPTARAYRCCVM